MIEKYRAIFRAPGSLAFCAASFLMRMPIAVYPLGIVLIISADDGRYSFAGLLTACYVLGYAVGTPVLAALVDRYGQRRVILPSGVVHAVAVVSLAAMLRSDLPDALLVVPTVLFGFAYISVGSLVRARWSYLFDGRPELSTALSVESVLDEVIFVVGPVITTLLATQADPALVLYVGVGLVAGGSVWLAAQHATEPQIHPREPGGRISALRTPGTVMITLSTVMMGAVFATAEISMVAYCGQHDHSELSGAVLAAMAAGSAVSGFVYGSIEWDADFDVLRRFRIQAILFAVLPFTMFAASNLAMLAVCGFVIGLGIAPTLITTFALVQQIVPARALTQGLSWVSTGVYVGYATGAALVGSIADQHGARTAFAAVVVSSVPVGVLGLLVRVRRDADTVEIHHD